MEAAYIYRKRVEFSETDMAGMVHFSNYFRWMEAAEVGLFEQLGYSLIHMVDGVTRGWPRVRAQCKYHEPVQFRDEIEVHLFVEAVKLRAVEYRFQFFRTGGVEPVHVATGSMTTVYALRSQQEETIQSADIEPSLAEALERLTPPAQ